MLLCAGDADADPDVTCEATATNPDSDVEATTGELTSKCLDGGGVGSWCWSVLPCMVCAHNSLIWQLLELALFMEQ
jgi:hypothetical protein